MDDDGALIDCNKADFIKCRQRATDRLKRQSEVAADFMPGHAQIELLAGIANAGEPFGQKHQEARDPCFGTQRAKHADHDLFAHEFPAHYAVQRRFKFGMGAAERGEFLEWHEDDVAVGKRDRFRGVLFSMNTVDADNVTLHGKAQHLFAARFVDHYGFQESGINDIQHIERLADRVNPLPRLELHMLKKSFRIDIERTVKRNAEQIAYLV